MLLLCDIQGCEAVDRAMESHRGRRCECEDAAGVEDGEVCEMESVRCKKW